MVKVPLAFLLFLVVIGSHFLNVLAAPPEQNSTKPITGTSFRKLSLPGDSRHTLWIPGDYELHGNRVDVLVNFHGSTRIASASCQAAGINCVVIGVNYAGLSSVYRVPFAEDQELLAKILEEALDALHDDPGFSKDAEWGQLAISSFSAGFGAVREVLKTPRYFDQIDGIYMVDSLYCGYVGDGTDAIQSGVVHPGLMKDFLRFARAASHGEKVMLVTHCCGPTPGYASTRETADYLLEKLNLEPQPVDLVVPLPTELTEEAGELRLYRQAERKGFSLYGSPGPNETDHVQHLLHMGYWLPKLSLMKREDGVAKKSDGPPRSNPLP